MEICVQEYRTSPQRNTKSLSAFSKSAMDHAVDTWKHWTHKLIRRTRWNMKYGGAQNTRHENTEQKNAAQKCTSGKCETTKMRERQDIERIMFEYRLLFRMTRWTKTYYDENILRWVLIPTCRGLLLRRVIQEMDCAASGNQSVNN